MGQKKHRQLQLIGERLQWMAAHCAGTLHPSLLKEGCVLRQCLLSRDLSQPASKVSSLLGAAIASQYATVVWVPRALHQGLQRGCQVQDDADSTL
jgi:hypothetical protein